MNDKTGNILLEDVHCPMGCPSDDVIILTGRDLLHDLPGEFTVVKCRTCGLMRTNPRPTPESIGFYYPEDYGPYNSTKVQSVSSSKSLIRRILKPIYTRLINFNTSVLPEMIPGKMLEIGCASGSFLHQMANQGWVVQGIEFSDKAAQSAAQLGYPVYSGPLEEAPQPAEPFDLIVGWMVLEHLYDPVACLKKLHDWSKPETWLVLSIPNAGSLEFRLFKDKWYALQLPTHLQHFVPSTLERVLFAGGWKLEKIYHQRLITNLIASLGYVLRDKGFTKFGQRFISFPERAGRWNYLLYPIAWLLSLFGQTGRMTVWAKVCR